MKGKTMSKLIAFTTGLILSLMIAAPAFAQIGWARHLCFMGHTVVEDMFTSGYEHIGTALVPAVEGRKMFKYENPETRHWFIWYTDDDGARMCYGSSGAEWEIPEGF